MEFDSQSNSMRAHTHIQLILGLLLQGLKKSYFYFNGSIYFMSVQQFVFFWVFGEALYGPNERHHLFLKSNKQHLPLFKTKDVIERTIQLMQTLADRLIMIVKKTKKHFCCKIIT